MSSALTLRRPVGGIQARLLSTRDRRVVKVEFLSGQGFISLQRASSWEVTRLTRRSTEAWRPWWGYYLRFNGCGFWRRSVTDGTRDSFFSSVFSFSQNRWSGIAISLLHPLCISLRLCLSCSLGWYDVNATHSFHPHNLHIRSLPTSKLLSSSSPSIKSANIRKVS